MTTVTRSIHFAVKGKRKRALLGPSPALKIPTGRTPRISKLMALAIRFDDLLGEGAVASQSELAKLAHVTQPRMTQIMNLLHLSPDIQEEVLFLPAVMHGRDPITERDLRMITQEFRWDRQRRRWKTLRSGRYHGPHQEVGHTLEHIQSVAALSTSY